MNNLIVSDECLEKFVDILNEFIDEVGLSGKLKVVKIKDDKEIKTFDTKKERRIRRDHGKFKIETSKHIDDIQKMLLNESTYEEISKFLRFKGENISKSSVGRYALKFFESIDNNNPPTKGGTL